MLVSLRRCCGLIGAALLPRGTVQRGLPALDPLPDEVKPALLLTGVAALDDKAEEQHEADTEKATEGRSRQGHRRLQV
jgi:hypothetical protein